MSRRHTIEQVRQALRDSIASMTPHEHFEEMVATGIINRKGEVTRLIGGEGEPEPGAKRPDYERFHVAPYERPDAPLEAAG